MYDHVLMPTDGSPGAEAAIEHAVDLAARHDAELWAVHVAGVMDLGDVKEMSEDVEDKIQSDAAALVEPVREAAEGVDVEVREVILRGQPHDELVEFVEAEDVDVVVMGTHSKTGLSRVILGSTAEKVVRHAPVPVMTVPAVVDE